MPKFIFTVPFYLISFSLLLLCLHARAQAPEANTFVPPGTRTFFIFGDVYKTSFQQPFRNLQAGLEAGYQLNDKIKFTGGLEFWDLEPTPLISLGNRFYPYGATFVRYRSLIGRTADIALGMGQNIKVGKSLMLEAAIDYYLDSRDLAFRLGIGYRWQRGEHPNQ